MKKEISFLRVSPCRRDAALQLPQRVPSLFSFAESVFACRARHAKCFLDCSLWAVFFVPFPVLSFVAGVAVAMAAARTTAEMGLGRHGVLEGRLVESYIFVQGFDALVSFSSFFPTIF